MSFYKQPKYTITDHASRRFQERNKKKLTFKEVELAIINMLEDSYEGEKLENGDYKLIPFSCKSMCFIITEDNIVKTFIKNK